MSGANHLTPETSPFYRVEEVERSASECCCPNCQQWTVVYTASDGEPTEMGGSWQGDAGKEHAEDICDLMNQAYEMGQNSREATITGLCDRLDRINNLTRPRPAKDPYAMLREIEEWSGGFAKVPT